MAKTSSENLRILHVAKWYPHPGDVQNGVFVRKHIKASAEFAEVKVLAWLPGEEKTITQESIEENIPVTRTYFKQGTPFSYKRQYFRDYIHSHYNNRNLPDLIHLHIFSPDLLLVLLWARKKKIPVVISEHWSGYKRGIFDSMPYWRKWAYRRLGRADVILPVSAFLMESMQKAGITGNYQIVPNVVDFLPGNQAASTTFKFVVIADLVDEIKNISGLIRSFSRVAEKMTGAELHIIGGGPDEAEIQNQVLHSPIKNQIRLYGRLDNEEVKKLLPDFNVLIINSRVETFGLVLLEAHAAGIPAICTRCGGPEEWIETGDILINPDDDMALADAILEMSKRGNQKYDFTKWKQCSNESVALRLAQIYKEIIRGRAVQKRKK